MLELYFLLETPIPGSVPQPLPPEVRRQTIDSSLWSQEEKASLLQHRAYLIQRFPIKDDVPKTFIEIYRQAVTIPSVIGIANPIARTAHHIRWAQKIFTDGLESIALKTPPLHLWTGLGLIQVELSLNDLLQGRTAQTWLRTHGYEQFALPNLAHPLQEIREVGWIHSLFEVLFDWMYFEKRILRGGEAIEVPERGRYLVQDLGESLLALIEWKEPMNGDT
ncbi:MAG: hypothetical protein RMK19_01895 [Bacteroidia bacterium]|nr:hypothetical protein [Bacteroidia bacterium]MDW8014746.1 hypothetical protein [Bacteroidia bacterium]